MSCKHYKNSPQKYYKIISFATFVGLLYACSTTKKVPDGDYLLTKNNFEFEDKKEFFDDELKDYVQQKPNKKQILFMPLGLMFYNMATPKYDTILNEYMTYPREMRDQKLRDSLFIKYNMKSSVGKNLFFDRLLHTWGAAPVILDQTRSEKSAESIKKRLTYRGYWDAEVKYRHNLDSASKKAAVNYFIKHNDPTYIKDYFFNIPDQGIKQVYNAHLNKTLVRSGKILDQTVLEKEVTRITDLMREYGYYKFNNLNEEVYFVADSLKSKKQVPLTLEIHRDSLDRPYKKATFGNIDVAIVDDANDYPKNTVKDSLRRIRFHKMNDKYKTSSLWRTIIVDSKQPYDQQKLDVTKRNLLTMNNFSIVKARDSLRQGGFTAPNDSIVDVLYILKPLPKYELKVGTDLNYSQILNLGVSPSVDLTTRNLFRGAENLSTSLSGTFGSIASTENTDKRVLAYEISAQASLNFPRLLLPFNYYKFIPKRYTPTSSILLGASIQNNIGLGRVNFNTGLNYQATVNDLVYHKLTLFNTQISLTKNKNAYYDYFTNDRAVRDEIFYNYDALYPKEDILKRLKLGTLTGDQLTEMILNNQDYLNSLDQQGQDLFTTFKGSLINKERQTQDVFISSMIYNFVYNEIGKKDYPNAFYFNGKVELAGNILSLFNKKSNDGGVVLGPQKTIFGIPYAQFVKFDIDTRKYFKFNGNQTLVLRQFIGVGIPYGNSDEMPIIKSYFNGGSNDIRAWVAFGGLGPADSQVDERVRAYMTNDVKLTTNIEYRVPFNNMYEGALFTDIGNTWSLRNHNDAHKDEFRFNKFLGQMGIGSGFGLRINVAYITLRLDFAYKIFDPNKPEGDRWRFKTLQPFKPTINFAFGYPF